MPMLDRVRMKAPSGQECMVMVRDREEYEGKGYTLAQREPPTEPEETGAEESGDGLDDLTVPALRERAAEADVELPAKATKAEIIGAIRIHRLAATTSVLVDGVEMPAGAVESTTEPSADQSAEDAE